MTRSTDCHRRVLSGGRNRPCYMVVIYVPFSHPGFGERGKERALTMIAQPVAIMIPSMTPSAISRPKSVPSSFST